MPFEILNRAFVFLRCDLAVECAKISSFACLGAFFLRIQPVFARFQFSDHANFCARCAYADSTLVALLNIRSALETRASNFGQLDFRIKDGAGGALRPTKVSSPVSKSQARAAQRES
jgi:hypothetical protein